MDNTIVFLAQLLLQAIKDQGYSIGGETEDDYGHVDLWVFNDNHLQIGSILHGWELNAKLEGK